MAETTASATAKGPLPPYIAFKTLIDLIERMEREEPPTRVDPTYLDTYAGGYRPTVISNLQTLGLLTKTGEPTELLLGLVSADEVTRKELMAKMLGDVYADVLALPKNSTQGQFLDAFTGRGAQGDTRRKAVSFFLKACKNAGVQTGTHWKTPPASASGTTRRRTPKPNGESGKVEPIDPTSGDEGAGEVVNVNLGAAGNVVVNVRVKWLQLDDETFLALRQAISAMKALAAAQETPADETAGTTDDDTEEESS